MPSAFETMSQQNGTAPKRANINAAVHVMIERNFGDVKITYGLTQTYVIATSADLAAAYDEVRSQVELQHELAQQNRPQLMPQQLKDQISQNQAIILCTAVRKENVAGKERIRLIGGEFSTHGVAVYPEYFDLLEIDPDALDYGDTPYHHHVLIQLDGRGNPKRAIQIVSQPT